MDKIAVVIPSYRVRAHILEVIAGLGPEIFRIYVVDDCCPEQSGQLVTDQCRDQRVRVLYHEANAGVGGATLSGYRAALEDGVDVVVKIDGDGQMDPKFIAPLVRPILQGDADYCKGNRFYDPTGLMQMPAIRLLGNACLSFLTKLSSGYWNVFDPTNGFTAISAKVLARLPLEKIEKRYFFESDMLFRLNTIRALVVDVPMPAQYGEESSSLSILKVIPEFLLKHGRNFFKRLFYNYYLRDFSVASIEILLGTASLTFGTLFGLDKWHQSHVTRIPVTSGTVMLAALPVIIGVQLVLAFINYDVQNVPREPLAKRLSS